MSSQTQIARIKAACRELATTDAAITFTAVAATTGLARSTLYRNPDLRALINDFKHDTTDRTEAITNEIDTLRAAVTVLAEQVRTHDKRLRSLERK
jgi:hypothetical protein